MRVPGSRWFEAWYDSRYAVPVLLAVFILVWTVFQIVAFMPVDLEGDVLEVYAWGRHPAAGYYKHPPLGGLIAAAWFAIFPARNWAAHLMAMSYAALSLYFVDLISRRYVRGDKRLLVLLLLMLTPFYQFHADRFGSNQTLLATWPLAVYAFIQSFERRSAAWGAAAGATGALAMLGKYYSVYLLGGLLVAALAHPDRKRYWRSRAPWMSLATGLLLVSPHLIWLRRTGYQPFIYAYAEHGVTPLGALATVPGYLLGGAGYVALPLIAYWFAARPRKGQVLAAFWPRDKDQHMLAVLLLVPLVLAPLSVPLLQVGLTSLWTMQAWFLLPVLLLLPDEIQVTRRAAVEVAALVAAIALGALAASPALVRLAVAPVDEGRAYYSPLAVELTDRWRTVADTPLSIVMGDPKFAMAATFYAPAHPDSVPWFYFPAAPWVTPARLEREGFAAVCRDSACVEQAMRIAGDRRGTRTQRVEVVPRASGRARAPATFVLVFAPPTGG